MKNKTSRQYKVSVHTNYDETETETKRERNKDRKRERLLVVTNETQITLLETTQPTQADTQIIKTLTVLSVSSLLRLSLFPNLVFTVLA